MNETLESILWVAIVLALLGFQRWSDNRWPAPPHKRMWREEIPTVCARCIYRDGEDCTNPKSPTYPGPIGEVCIGRLKCKVREAAVDGFLRQE